jgi:hypothetical protein
MSPINKLLSTPLKSIPKYLLNQLKKIFWLSTNMAGLNNYSIMVSVFLASVVLISPKLTFAIFEWVPTPLPEPKPGFFKFLKDCAKSTSPKCGKEVFDSIFKTGMVSKNCCLDLVLMGKTCHDEFTKYTAHGPDFKAHLSEYLAKSEQVYNKCVSVAVPPDH